MQARKAGPGHLQLHTHRLLRLLNAFLGRQQLRLQRRGHLAQRRRARPQIGHLLSEPIHLLSALLYLLLLRNPMHRDRTCTLARAHSIALARPGDALRFLCMPRGGHSGPACGLLRASLAAAPGHMPAPCAGQGCACTPTAPRVWTAQRPPPTQPQCPVAECCSCARGRCWLATTTIPPYHTTDLHSLPSTFMRAPWLPLKTSFKGIFVRARPLLCSYRSVFL